MIRELINAQRVALAALSDVLHLTYEAGDMAEYDALRLRRVVRTLELQRVVEEAQGRGELTAGEAERAMSPIVSTDTAEVFR